MDQNILSLKNIYRFLTVYDYPTYSIGIIREKEKKGMTLTKFWQDILLSAWRSGNCGGVIWRTGGSRSRYLSEVCNRSLQMRHVGGYVQEVISRISPKLALQQIHKFTDFLVEKRYQYDAFVQKWPFFYQMLCSKDALFDADVSRLFRDNEQYRESLEKEGEKGRLFYAGWVLTMLTLHAMAGSYMTGREMAAIRKDTRYGIANLWNSSQAAYRVSRGSLKYMNQVTDRWMKAAIPRQHFFGREQELFDLREKLCQGGKYILTGPSGVGKTELLRQLLVYCSSEKVMDALIVIPYQGSLAESIPRESDEEKGIVPTTVIEELVDKIKALQCQKVLLLIDHVDHGAEEDKALTTLAGLTCHIFMTAEKLQLDGFEEISVENVSTDSALLILRDNYGMPIARQDCRVMKNILTQDSCRNTQRLCSLGRMAKQEKWSAQELCWKIANQGNVGSRNCLNRI